MPAGPVLNASLLSSLLALLVLAGCAPPDAPTEGSGEVLVFASARTGDGDIYWLDLDTRTPTLLVQTPVGEGNPVYDSARDRIVYQSFGDDTVELRSSGSVLLPDPNGDAPPAWSPSGGQIVYSAMRDGKEHLYQARTDGSEESRLTDGDVIDRYPTISPDGKRVAFARRLPGGWDLHTLDLSTRAITRLTDNGVYVGHPAWSPDGSRIAFDTLIGEQAEIAYLDLATGSIVRLTERAGNDLKPGWSLDGTRIAFGADVGSQGNWEIYEIDMESRAITRITQSPGFDGAPVYVPRSALEQ